MPQKPSIIDTFKPENYFTKNSLVNVIPRNGYVSLLDNSPAQLTEDDAVKLKNYDLQPDGARRRPPYALFMDLTALLDPIGYKIGNFCEKQFTDKTTNTTVTVYVVLAYRDGTDPNTRQTHKSKIYISHYYLPSDGSGGSVNYDNAWTSEAVGRWVEGWTLLTERYKTPVTAEEPAEESVQFAFHDDFFPPSNHTYYLTALDTRLVQSINYYKGWYVIDRTGNIVGQAYGSHWNGTTLSIYVNVDDGADMSACGICRFMVSQTNLTSLFGLKDINFNIQQEGVIRITGRQSLYDNKGKVLRPFHLSFLQEKKDFGGFRIQGVGFTGSPGNWLEASGAPTQATDIYIKCLYTQIQVVSFKIAFQWSIDNVTWTDFYYQNVGLPTFDYTSALFGVVIRIHGYIPDFVRAGQVAHITTSGSETQRLWNGFWFDNTGIEIPNKKVYRYTDQNSPTFQNIGFADIGRELGIEYLIKPVSVTTADKQYRVYSLAIELDGYQLFFVKQCLTNDKRFLEITPRIHSWYNRRISGHNLYYADFDSSAAFFSGNNTPSPSHNDEVPSSFLLDDGFNGKFPIDKWALYKSVSPEAGSYYYYFDLIKFSSETSTFKLIDHADAGVSLQGYLNNDYWTDVNIAPEILEPVGNNYVGCNCRYDIDGSPDDLNKKRLGLGSQYIVISQFQNGAVYCPDVMCTERMRQYSIGFPLLAVSPVIGNQFLVYTSYDMKRLEILDAGKCVIGDIATFENRGLISKKGLVSAFDVVKVESGQPTTPMESVFKGIYYLSQKTVYGIAGSNPQDTLTIKDESGRVIKKLWQQEYQGLDKSVMLGTYNVNNDQIIFLVKVSNSVTRTQSYELRIYQIPYGRWIVYSYPDVPLGFVQSLDGEVYFWTSDNKIYKTEPVNTSLWRDKQNTDLSGGIEIPTELDRILTHGDNQVSKIPDSFAVSYDIAATGTVQVQAQIYDEDNLEIYNKTVDLVSLDEPLKDYIKYGTDKRIRCVWYRFNLISIDNTNLINFKINQTKNTAMLVAGTFVKE